MTNQLTEGASSEVTTSLATTNGNNNAIAVDGVDNRVDFLLFDLDGTLYDHDCGYEEEIHSNIFKFMVETKGGKFDAVTTLQQAQTAWQPIFDKYNLTKRGLIGEGYVFDSRHYDIFVRQGATKYFNEDVELRLFLESFPSRMKKSFSPTLPNHRPMKFWICSASATSLTTCWEPTF